MEYSVKSELRKKQIIEVGKKLFAQNGYYGTHVESILQDAKIGKGTFYLYFKNKEDLFITILEEFLEQWENGLKDSLATIEPTDLHGCYSTMITSSFRFFRVDPYISKIFVRVGPGTNELIEPYIERFEETMIKYLMDFLQKGINNGLFRKDLDIELVANILAGGHLRIAYTYFINKPKNRTQRSIANISEAVYHMVIKGLLAA
jgi:TetR/AcrR family fatty acid metabolism transcriptional regulator